MNPEIRIYDQPQTITSEADISSNLLSDNFIVFNIINDDGFYNVRYQIKPFMIWIWISIILLSLGGFLSLISIFFLISFYVLFKGLNNTNSYSPEQSLEIDTNIESKLLYSEEKVSLNRLIQENNLSIINIIYTVYITLLFYA